METDHVGNLFNKIHQEKKKTVFGSSNIPFLFILLG